MPSLIGHALAGVAVAWAADLVPGDRTWRTVPGTGAWHQRAGGDLTLACAALSAAPDLDLAFITHRTVTHSIGAVFFVGWLAAALAVHARRPIARVSLMCAAAYASHLLLDWLGTDRYRPLGLQLLWPISSAWFISGLDLFRQTARFGIFTRGAMTVNLYAIVQETLILGPVVVALWLIRVKALAGLAPEMARRDHPPK